MAEERERGHISVRVNMTLRELDRELNSSYPDPVRSRIVEAVRAHGIETLRRDLAIDEPDGGTHFDTAHIDHPRGS
jgi:hypothetical protein